MRNFLKNVISQKQTGSHALLGRLVQVGPYNLRVESHISDGGFAAIFKVRDVATGKSYALKHMRLMGDKEAIADCMTEINTLKVLRQVPSVVSLRAAAFTGSKGHEQEAYLVLDLCTINLAEYVNSQEKAMSTASIIEIFSCICQAVSAMHQQNPPLSHRDLKPENVLKHTEGGWVLCDFGSVSDKPCIYETSDQVMMGEEVMRKYTTPAYRAPEMWDLYSRDRIDTKADIWALGCLLYFLMYSKLAFQPEAKLQILNGDIIIPPSRPPPLVELLRELLVVSPQRRSDIRRVLRRLQEVAELLNIDPALLIPSTPTPRRSGSFREGTHLPGASAPAGDRKHLAERPPSFSRQSATTSPAEPPQKLAAVQQKPAEEVERHVDNANKQQKKEVDTPAQEGFADFSKAFASNPTQREPDLPTQRRDATPALPQHPSSLRAPLYPVVDPVQSSSPRRSPTRLQPQGHARDIQSPEFQNSRSGPGGKSAGETQSLTVQQQLADALSQIEKLKSLLEKREATIAQLQAENSAHVSQLQQLGLEPTPVLLPTPEPALDSSASPSGDSQWASFENAFETSSFNQPSAASHTTHTFEPSFAASGPTPGAFAPQPAVADLRTRSNSQASSLGRTHSPGFDDSSQLQKPNSLSTPTYAEQFFRESEAGPFHAPNSQDVPHRAHQTLPSLRMTGQHSAHPMGGTHERSLQSSPVRRQQDPATRLAQTLPGRPHGLEALSLGAPGQSNAVVSPKTDAFSAGSLSETTSRKSVFSAFEESLKQPALAADDMVSSPLSDASISEEKNEVKSLKSSLPKFPKKSHRRSTSEPAAVENWNLIKDSAAQDGS